jgi:hypothetical protein
MPKANPSRKHSFKRKDDEKTFFELLERISETMSEKVIKKGRQPGPEPLLLRAD